MEGKLDLESGIDLGAEQTLSQIAMIVVPNWFFFIAALLAGLSCEMKYNLIFFG